MEEYIRDIFSKDENISYILSSVVDLVSSNGGENFDISNEYLINSFNKVASSVFSVEINRQSKKPPNEIIKYINNVVIKELTKYILSNYNKSFTLPKKEQEMKVETTIETTKYSMNNRCKKFNEPILNPVSIQLLQIYINNGGRIINEKNNKIYYHQIISQKPLYSETKEIIIPIKDYQNLSEVIEELNKNPDIIFSLNDENKVETSSTIPFEFIGENINLLNLLGINSKAPIVFRKTRLVNLQLYLKEGTMLFNEPLLIKDNENFIDFTDGNFKLLENKIEEIEDLYVKLEPDTVDTITEFCLLFQIKSKNLKNSYS